MRGGERAQATPLMAALVVLVGVVALALVRLGAGAVDAARAQTAADAAALAAASGAVAGRGARGRGRRRPRRRGRRGRPGLGGERCRRHGAARRRHGPRPGPAPVAERVGTPAYTAPVSAEQPSAVENAPPGHPDDLVGAAPTVTTARGGLDEAALPTTDETAAGRRRLVAAGLGRRAPQRRCALAPRLVAAGVRTRRRCVVRVVRRVQLWSVFKVALLSFLVFYGITLLAAAAVWSLANSTGQVHHIEKFMRDIGFDNWTFDGGRLFSATAFIGAVLVVLASVFATLAGGAAEPDLGADRGHPLHRHRGRGAHLVRGRRRRRGRPRARRRAPPGSRRPRSPRRLRRLTAPRRPRAFGLARPRRFPLPSQAAHACGAIAQSVRAHP